MAKQRQARRPVAKRPFGWLHGLVCGAVIALAPATALLVAGLLAPGLLAWSLEADRQKPVARTVVLAGLAASIGPLRVLWRTGGGLAMASGLAMDLSAIGPAWAAAAGGWLLSQLAPLAVQSVLHARNVAWATGLRQEREQVVSEWRLDDPD